MSALCNDPVQHGKVFETEEFVKLHFGFGFWFLVFVFLHLNKCKIVTIHKFLWYK